MPGSGFAREARRRPDLDLLLGPVEAAAMNDDGSRSESVLEDVEFTDPSELPTWREDG